MKLIYQTAKFLGQTPQQPMQLLKFMERVGRICYKSEDKITALSAPKFCSSKFKVGHYPIFDHSNIVFRIKTHLAEVLFRELSTNHGRGGYHKIRKDRLDCSCVSGNVRAWEETLQLLLSSTIKKVINGASPYIANILCDLCELTQAYLPELFNFDLLVFAGREKTDTSLILTEGDIPTSLKMYSVFWITDRSVTHEIVRHRPCAFMQESQRYVTYESGLTCIIPNHMSGMLEGTYHIIAGGLHYNLSPLLDKNEQDFHWLISMIQNERTYKRLLKREDNPNGWAPQHARDVLPNSCKTEIMITADLKEWKHIFNMRCAKSAHPKIRQLAITTLLQFSMDKEIVESGILTEQFEKFLGA